MNKSIFYGIVGGISIFAFYLIVLTLVNSFAHAVEQFFQIWYFILPLVIGFGIQVGLFYHVRSGLRKRNIAGNTGMMAASGGVSTGSMILCCLHHVTDVLPILGFSVATLFLVQYQSAFLVLGIMSNIIGIMMLLNVMQKTKIRKFEINMQSTRNFVFLFSIIIVLAAFIITTTTAMTVSDEQNNKLITKYNSENGVDIDATPTIDQNSVMFDIGLNTHIGSLDFDVADVSIMKDSTGKIYEPLRWEEFSSGGHHRSGKLYFPLLDDGVQSFELILKDIYDVSERIFSWELV